MGRGSGREKRWKVGTWNVRNMGGRLHEGSKERCWKRVAQMMSAREWSVGVLTDVGWGEELRGTGFAAGRNGGRW